MCCRKKGIGLKKEGDLITPKGSLELKEFFIEKTVSNISKVKFLNLLSKKIWVGVTIQSQNITISL